MRILLARAIALAVAGSASADEHHMSRPIDGAERWPGHDGSHVYPGDAAARIVRFFRERS